jgi:hypothetical protein
MSYTSRRIRRLIKIVPRAFSATQGVLEISCVRRGAQMSKVYAGLLVAVALIAMAAIGTLALIVITDVSYWAYQALRPGMTH